MIGRLERVEVSGFLGVDSLSLTFPTPADPEQGQWVVLLGDNGTGKSSLLRAIALCIGPGYVLISEIQSRYASMVRLGRNEAKLSTVFGGAHRRLTIRAPGAENGRASIHGENAEARRSPFIVGYGALRGTALGGPKRAVEIDAHGLLGIRSLFFEDAPVIHAETWLRDLAFAGTRDPVKQKLLDAVRTALCRILIDVHSIDIDPDQTWVRGAPGATFGRIPLAAMSDGYLTSAGWLIDMLARWLKYAETNDIVVDADFLEKMEGLVLVDEIDLHLHPRWQVEIISTLRETFPRLSFVVTTHNPMTIQGAKPGEVWVLRREPTPSGDTRVTATQRDVPLGMRADQILTGDWFGLPSTLDPETQSLLEQHRILLREGADEADRERVQIEDELRQRLGRFAETSVERIAQEIVANAVTVTEEELPRLRAEFQKAFDERPRHASSTKRAKTAAKTRPNGKTRANGKAKPRHKPKASKR